MPLRFRKTKTILPGVRLNLSKSGLSTSLGPKGARLNLSKRGLRQTTSIPGTGIYHTQDLTPTKKTRRKLACCPLSLLLLPFYLLSLILIRVSVER